MKAKFEIFYEVRRSEKTGKVYVWAYIDLGYRKVSVTFDKGTIAEMFNIPVSQIYSEIENFKG